MAPKKSVDSTIPKKKREKKPAKPKIIKVKQAKPKLRTPTVIKLKIPTNGLIKTPKDENILPEKCIKIKKEPGPKIARKLPLDKKIELANEVARTQLMSKANGSSAVQTPVEVTAEKPKPRGRKKMIPDIVDTPTITSATDSEEVFEATPQKRKYVKKTPQQPGNSKKSLSLKKNNVTEKKSPSLSLKRQTKTTDSNDSNTAVTQALKKTKRPAENVKSKSEPKPKRKKLVRKGKLETGDPSSEVQISPSILDTEPVPYKSPKTEINSSYESLKDKNVEASQIDSRKTSMTGTSECLSWTKDISDSSTTMCVNASSQDFCRIDNKIPILKLNQHKVKPPLASPSKELSASSNELLGSNKVLSSSNNELSLSDTSDSENASLGCSLKSPERESSEMESHSLNLSTSSITSKSNNPNSLENREYGTSNEINEITKALDKLTSKLKNFDTEMINWIGYDNEEVDVEMRRFQDKIFRALQGENKVITDCWRLKQLFSDNIEEEPALVCKNDEQHQDKTVTDHDFRIPQSACPNSIIDTMNNNNRQCSDLSEDSEHNFTSDNKVKYKSFDQSYDDDDALSLFAESITGIDSKVNGSTSTAQNFVEDTEEYVPKSIRNRWDPVNKNTYVPTKIQLIDKNNQDFRSKSICEKQNADSTSIYKEPERITFDSNFDGQLEEGEITENYVPNNTVLGQNVMVQIRKPELSSFNTYKRKSVVFTGICFRYLISNCNKMNCTFPHQNLDHTGLMAKLAMLTDAVFVNEYMVLRDWPMLRRKYGICYVEECKRRQLNRILVEMSIDYILRENENYREDKEIKVEVLESVLLHLNKVNLEHFSELLLFQIRNGLLLCDFYMEAIANTQNFSRFKQVFLNLTKFILHHNRTLSLDVASKILERVSILPCDQQLSEALLGIIKNTDRTIFKNHMLGHFEKQLSSLDGELLKEFSALKESSALNESSAVDQPDFNGPYMSVTLNAHNQREKRYTSPDTTNVDSMNRAAEEPIIARSVELRPAVGANLQRSFNNSNSSMSNDSEELRATKRQPYHNRRNSPVNMFRAPHPFRPAFRPPMRPPRPQQRPQRPMMPTRRVQQYSFGPTPKYPWRPGPEYY